jgi:hypothetical protein
MTVTSRRRSIGEKRKGSTKDAKRAERNAARRAPRAAPVSRPRTADTSPRQRTRKRTVDQTRKRQRVNDPAERTAIQVLYHNLGSPPREDWSGRGGTVSLIKNGLHLACAPRKIKRTLDSIATAAEEDTLWSPQAASARGGRKRKLSQVECEIAADQLARGTGLAQTLFCLNDLRRTARKSAVSRTTLRDSVKAVLGAKRQKTTRRPTGNKDVDSTWAKARLAQATQYRAQLKAGARRGTRQLVGAAAKPLELSAIAWWDEKHMQCVLGKMGKHTWTYPVGRDGRFLSEADGGEHFEAPQVTVPKFAQEARFAFGVMMKAVDGGRRLTGVRMKPFEYTGKKMLGVAAYEKLVKDEVAQTAEKKGGDWRKVRQPTASELNDPRYIKGGRWFLQHGDMWEGKISDFLKTVCVTELINHIISEGNIAFARTPHEKTWVIGHDVHGEGRAGLPRDERLWTRPAARPEGRHERGDSLREASSRRLVRAHAARLEPVRRLGQRRAATCRSHATASARRPAQVLDGHPCSGLELAPAHVGGVPDERAHSRGHQPLPCCARQDHRSRGRVCARARQAHGPSEAQADTPV